MLLRKFTALCEALPRDLTRAGAGSMNPGDPMLRRPRLGVVWD